MTHPAVPLCLRFIGGNKSVPRRLLLAAVFCSAVPDIDAIGYWAGVPYDSLFGHRGLTHSLAFAAFLAAAGALIARRLGSAPFPAFALLFLSGASHGLLDAMTTGGMGVAFFSPFSRRRYFLPWRVIRVSPIGVSAFFSGWGREVLVSELLYVWIPCLIFGAAGVLLRRRKRAR